MSILPGGLTGTNYVRVIRPAFQDVKRLLPHMRHRAELRRQALKLRFWGSIDPSHPIVDLDWSWIKALRNEDIAEVRISDVLDGKDNLRVITWHPNENLEIEWAPEYGPVKVIWVLAVMNKRRQEFTNANLATFRLRRQTALERFYSNPH